MGTIAQKIARSLDTKEGLKNTINTYLGQDITSAIPFKDYETYIKNFYNSLPKTDYAEGSNITLSNTLKGKLDFEDGIVGIGDTKQEIDLTENNLTSQSANGLTITVNTDKSIKFNGTATANTTINILNNTSNNTPATERTLEAGTYQLTGCPSGSDSGSKFKLDVLRSGYIALLDSGSGDIKTLTSSQTYTYFRIQIFSGTQCNNLVFRPKLLKIPSPSYPQDIEVVRGKNRVETTQKGYWDNNGNWINTNYNCSSNKIEVQEGKTYVGSMFDKNKNYINKMVYVVFDKDDTFIRYSGDDTITIANGEKYVSIRSYNAQTSYVENDNYLIQFEENITHTSYLPYNTLEIVESGKNKANIEWFEDNYTLDNSGLPTAFNGRIANTTPIDVSKSDEVTISYKPTSKLFIYSLLDSNNTLIRRVSGNTNGTTINTSTASKLYISFYDNATLENMSEIQVEQGSATPYEPYITPTSYQLSLGEYEFAKIPDTNYRDTIVYDIENDKVYKNEKIGRNDFDENLSYEDFSAYWGQGSFGTRLTNIGTDKIAWSDMLCKYFVAYTSSETKNLNNEMVVGTSSMIFNNLNISTLTEWITWVTTHHFSVYYPKSTPTLIELTDTTLKQQVKNWYYSQSFNGTTIIEVDGDLPLIIKTRALKGA